MSVHFKNSRQRALVYISKLKLTIMRAQINLKTLEEGDRVEVVQRAGQNRRPLLTFLISPLLLFQDPTIIMKTSHSPKPLTRGQAGPGGKE